MSAFHFRLLAWEGKKVKQPYPVNICKRSTIDKSRRLLYYNRNMKVNFKGNRKPLQLHKKLKTF